NASNFNSLKVAWQWNAGAFGSDEYYRTTPLYANGRLFTVATTRREAMAIDPATGETLWMWRLDEGIRWRKAARQFAGRGLAYCSPAIVVNDVIVVGNSAIHGYYPIRAHNIPGFVRGFDVHTGRQLWKFNLIPQAGEFGADTWVNGTKLGTEGVGKNDPWATYSADPELGLVYVPVGMPLSDEYGGPRPGNNLFTSSVRAIDVKTGQRKWHYQFVHHDIWDYDTPM